MNSRDRGASMWAEALELLQDADRLHRQFFQLASARPQGPCWEPPVDVFETAQALLIIVALPGVGPDQVEVVLDRGTLLVIGERPMATSSGAVIRRLELPYGRFERRIQLPPGRFELGQRHLEHGCLRLSLRKLSQTPQASANHE